MTFDKSTSYQIQELNLHDAEITNVFCNYNMHRIEIPIKLSNCQNKSIKALITFEGVHYADISFFEPWGAGIYVNEIIISDGIDIVNRLDSYQNNNECFCLSILLNSGDKINVLSAKVTYSII